jgi:hypothetical protein
VVMVKQPGHLTSMKKERGAGTRVYLSKRIPTSAIGPRTLVDMYFGIIP